MKGGSEIPLRPKCRNVDALRDHVGTLAASRIRHGRLEATANPGDNVKLPLTSSRPSSYT